jgi:sirohydrochlorin cobaltochelatase
VKKTSYIAAWLFVCLVCSASLVLAGGHARKRPVKKGILLVAFGTSIPEARVAFENIEKKVKAAYPGIPVRWAYTSTIIRHKLAKQGKMFDSPEVALAKMMDEQFTHVAVQSLHTIAGAEFHELRRNTGLFGGMAGGFDRIIVGYPLLATDQDIQRTAGVILQVIPKQRKKGEAVVLMGHGTHHPSNAFYAALMFRLQQTDPNIFVGGVEGYPEIDNILSMLKAKNIKKAWLMPFMSVAGDHALNDLAGDEKDSWKSILTQNGIGCEVILKGTAEYDGFVDIWVDHLAGPLSHFK